MQFNYGKCPVEKFSQRDFVWDIKRGLVVCIDEKQRIVSAMRGMGSLTQKEIKEVYGENNTFWWIKDEVIRQLEKEKDAYWVFFAADF